MKTFTIILLYRLIEGLIRESPLAAVLFFAFVLGYVGWRIKKRWDRKKEENIYDEFSSTPR